MSNANVLNLNGGVVLRVPPSKPAPTLTTLEIFNTNSAFGLRHFVATRHASKAAFQSGWENNPITTAEQAAALPQDSGLGVIAYATLGDLCFLEFDSLDAISRIESETGKKPPRSLMFQGQANHFNIIYFHTPKSIALGNVAQGFVKDGDFSFRADRQYIMASGSIHPATQKPYTVVCKAPIVPIPDWLVDWIAAQKISDKKKVSVNDGDPIPEGSRNDALTSKGGSLRRAGLNHAEIELALLRMNAELCNPPLSEEEVRTIAGSVSRYAVGRDETFLISGVPAGYAVSLEAKQAAVEQVKAEQVEREATIAEEMAALPAPAYPVFPYWVMEGMSIYEGFVKPVCDANCRLPEFMFMPALALLMNYIGVKVRVEYKDLIPSLYLLLVGRRGEVIKSSCVEDAIDYFCHAGVMEHSGPHTKNADGKSLIFTVGSPEGLTLDMSRTNCRNACLFFDELSKLANKTRIETSSLLADLLTAYESGKLQNVTKSQKTNCSLNPGTYCMSLISCVTDKNYLEEWAKLSGNSTGLEDRFFVLFQPNQFKPRTPQVFVDTRAGALETRKLIDRAIQKGVYSMPDQSLLSEKMESDEFGNRDENRAERFALAFAVDLGRDTIDADCVRRGVALAEYNNQVRAYLQFFEANTREGSLQMQIISALQKSGNKMEKQVLERTLNFVRYGTRLWNDAYIGLMKAGIIRERGKGTRGDPCIVELIRAINLSGDED